jgi:hypothetical protein
MNDGSVRHYIRRAALRFAAAAVAAAMLGLALAGCGLATAVHKVAATVHSNSSIINLFTAKLKSGQPDQFEVTYVTTGSNPSKITYAVQPPHDLAFTDSGSGTGAPLSQARLIVNSAGVFGCTHGPADSGGSGSSGPAGWSCEKLPKVQAASEQKILDLYTPSHWVAFLKEFALAAGFAGDKISTSAMTVNGFAMSCVDFVAPGVPGKSKICTTAQHLLGYVNVASSSTAFEITSYSATPAAGLFRLPRGAKVKVAKLPKNGSA